jgi:hypothetical protein
VPQGLSVVPNSSGYATGADAACHGMHASSCYITTYMSVPCSVLLWVLAVLLMQQPGSRVTKHGVCNVLSAMACLLRILCKVLLFSLTYTGVPVDATARGKL